jgi:hypothetical protein
MLVERLSLHLVKAHLQTLDLFYFKILKIFLNYLLLLCKLPVFVLFTAYLFLFRLLFEALSSNAALFAKPLELYLLLFYLLLSLLETSFVHIEL